MQSIVYYGEIPCEKNTSKGEPCRNLAYYNHNSNFLCGVHCKSKDRVILPKRGKNSQGDNEYVPETVIAHKESCESASKDNRENGKKGNVKLCKLYMLKRPDLLPGYINILPNNRAKTSHYGLAYNELSPMRLGPVNHGQPDLPPSLNIENFHQGSKCFTEEIIVDEKGQYIPGELYYTNRLHFYTDPVPHRYKYKGDKKNKNIPKYFVWVDKEGKENHLNYIESRQFYCNFYERLAKETQGYNDLVDKLKQGYNLRICGYDAHEITKEGIENAYLSPHKPFGHELVLYTLLVCTEDEYPWRKYKTFEF